MPQPQDVEIPQPLGSGATDQPDVPQHGVPEADTHGMTFDASPVQKATHVKNLSAVSHPDMTFDAAPVDKDTHVSKAAVPPGAAPKAQPVQPTTMMGAIGNMIAHPLKALDTANAYYKNLATPPSAEAKTTTEQITPTVQRQTVVPGELAGDAYLKGIAASGSGTPRRVMGAVGELGTLAPNMARQAYHAFTDAPTAEEQKLAITSPVTGRESLVGRAALAGKRMLYDPQAAEMAKARTAPTGPESVAHTVAGSVPLVGPLVSGLAEQAGTGDIAGAITKGAAYAALPKVAEDLPKVTEGPAFPTATAAANKIVRGTGKAADKVLKNPELAGTVIGAATGHGLASVYVGSKLGKIAAKLGIEVPEDWKYHGMNEAERDQAATQDRYDVASKVFDKAKAQYDRAVRTGQDTPVPKDIAKTYQDAKEEFENTTEHLKNAKETVAKGKAPSVPDQPMTVAPKPAPAPVTMAKPAEPVAPTAPTRAMNVKGPGEVQPETFPQQPTPAPMVRPGQAEIPGGRMGRTMQLPEAPQQFPQEILPPEPKPKAPVAAKEPTTIEMGPGKLATPEPEAKAAPTTPAVKPEDLKTQIERGLGNKKIEPGVKIGEQGKTAADDLLARTNEEMKKQQAVRAQEAKQFEAEAKEPEKLSSRPDKAMLQKAKATPEEIEKILPLTRVELSKLAGHFDVDLGDKAIGRGKGDVAAGTHLPREQVLQKIVDAGHSTADIAKAIDEGKHFPGEVGGGAPTSHEDQAAAHNENGGSTFHPEKGNLNGKPFFSVGGEPEFDKPELRMTTDGNNLTAAQMKEFSERPAVKEALDKHKDGSIGTWHDKETNKTTTELVKTPADRETAIQMGKDNNQKAIYDLGKGEEISTGGTGEGERRATRRAPMNAAETEEAMKSRKPFTNVVNETEGAQALINKDTAQRLEAAKYAAPDKGVPETALAKGPEAEKAQAATVASDKLAEEWKAASEEKPKATGYSQKADLRYPATTEKFPTSAYEDKGNGMHEVRTGPGNSLGHLTAQDLNDTTVQEVSHWVAKDARGKGLGAQQLETLSQSLPKEKTTLVSDELSPSAEGAWKKFQSQYPDAVTKTDKGYSVDLRKMRGEELPSVGGGSGKGKLPTGDELVDKYGESSGDPAHTAFILKDGRGVDLPAGVEHDAMLGGKPTDNLREQFIADGNIRLRPRSGRGGREVALSIPESGVSDKQLDYLKKMAPQLKSGTVVIEVGKPDGGHTTIPYGEATPEALEKAIKGLAPAEAPLTAKQEAKVGKLADEIEAKVKEGAFDPLSEEHLTAEEKAGLSKSGIARRNYADNMAKLPPLQELVDFAKGGEGARKWYERSRAAFKALHEEAPRYFQPDDGERWANFTASLSPRQMVHKNLAEAIHAWTQWTDDGRPMDDAGIKDSLGQAIKATPQTKIPNATKALQGKDMWPDLTKNSNFKVPSFGMNLSPAENLAKAKAFANAVTNDGWQALVHGVDEKTISSPSSYHPLSVMARAVAKELGWEPEEAQAAMWSFAQALKERGEADPQFVREYSQDFADIMSQDKNIRKQMQSLGVDLGKLDTKLKAIGEKPEVTPGASPTTEHSTRQLKERIEVARGKGSVPEPKQQSRFYFKEPSATEGRTRVPDAEEDTSFDPEQFRTQTNEPVMEKLGKKKSPMRKMNA